MINSSIFRLLFVLLVATAPAFLLAQHDGHDHSGHDHSQHDHTDHANHNHDDHGHDAHAGDDHGHHDMPYADRVMHHIGDANEIHLFGDVHIPLPCLLYSKTDGLTFCMSSSFDHGHKVIDGYVLDHGDVKRIKGWKAGMLDRIDGTESEVNGKEFTYYAVAGGQKYELEKPAMVYNLGSASWIDFSLTKNVTSMFIALLIMFFVFTRARKGYATREGQAPKGIQSLIETLFVFIRDEVVAPSIGPKYERFMPFVMSLFFFILFCNLFGLIPLIGGANITGNVGTTLALAVFTFFVVNFSANKHYWEHIMWMPGVPTAVRLILMPIELVGIFVKPFTLFIRLFANITAGHILILVLVGLIFIMGENGQNMGGAFSGGLVGGLFAFAMNFLELFVAFLQAYIFALLTSLYIGAAVADHHHDDHDTAHAH